MSRRVPPTFFRGQRVLLVGLGLHGGGLATAKWLVRQGVRLRITDTKTAAQLRASRRALTGWPITFHFGGHSANDWAWPQRIVVNPDVWPQLPALRRAEKSGLQVDNEASIFLREFPGVTLGVTGTRGKTTTARILGDMLKHVHRQTIISGNVREVAMLSYVPAATASTWAVLELSSYQLERLPVDNHPIHVAIMTNLNVDHLNRHRSMGQYAAIKYRLFAGQTKNDWKVLNWDDRWCRRAAKVGQGKILWFARDLPLTRDGLTSHAGWVCQQLSGQRRKLFPLSAWSMSGQHNLLNLLAATAAARAMGLEAANIQRAVQQFSGTPYRQQAVRTYHGHAMINDTAATSPDATLAALAVYPRALLILGGTDKALDFKPLVRQLVAKNISTVFLPGSATKIMQTQLRQRKYRYPLVSVASMSGAVATALRIAGPGQAIILSPGAASFGLFVHEFDRGDQFNQVVQKLT